MEGAESKIEWWGKRLILALYLPLGALFLWNYSSERAHRQDEQRHAAHYADHGEQRIARVCLRRETPQLVAECVADTITASRENQRREQEARADQETAAWTLLSALFAFISLGVSIAGIWVLWRTIKQGQDQLAHAQQTADAELRPWLQIEIEPGSFTITPDVLSASFTAIVTNVGRTPAQNVRIGHRLVLEERGTIERCRELFALPAVLLAFGQHSRALLPKGVARISRRARMPIKEAISVSETYAAIEEGMLPSPIIMVVAYYYCPGHNEASKTAMTFRLSRTVAVPGPLGASPSTAPAYFSLNDKRISASDIKGAEYVFCEAT